MSYTTVSQFIDFPYRGDSSVGLTPAASNVRMLAGVCGNSGYRDSIRNARSVGLIPAVSTICHDFSSAQAAYQDQ